MYEDPSAQQWHAGCPSDQAGSLFLPGPLTGQCLLRLSPPQPHHQLSSPERMFFHNLWPTQDVKESKNILPSLFVLVVMLI